MRTSYKPLGIKAEFIISNVLPSPRVKLRELEANKNQFFNKSTGKDADSPSCRRAHVSVSSCLLLLTEPLHVPLSILESFTLRPFVY